MSEGEQVVLDVNLLAEGKEYCSVGGLAVSPSKTLLAYTVDFSGNEKYLLYVINLETREQLFHDDKLETSGDINWGLDDTSLFYLTMDETKRPDKLWRKRLNSDSKEDEMIKSENDPQFWSGIFKTKDKKYLVLDIGSGETSECWFVDLEADAAAGDATTTLECIAPRRFRVLYSVNHRSGFWWISSKTGEETPNMRLFTSPAKANCQDEWTLVNGPEGQPLFDGGYERALSGVSVFQSHNIVTGREGGIPRVWVLTMKDETPAVTNFECLTFEEEAYDVGLTSHYEYNTETIMVCYDSMITPTQYIDISLSNLEERTVVKKTKVPNYNKDEYDCDRYFVTSRDGSTQIPVLRVFRKDVMEEHKSSGKPVPTHLYGYGAYAICCEADFRATRLQLLQRGIVFVLAQIRGGGEIGRKYF